LIVELDITMERKRDVICFHFIPKGGGLSRLNGAWGREGLPWKKGKGKTLLEDTNATPLDLFFENNSLNN